MFAWSKRGEIREGYRERVSEREAKRERYGEREREESINGPSNRGRVWLKLKLDFCDLQ